MAIKIDGNTLRDMIVAGADELSKHQQIVNDINVFPIPDGDTGTNMSLTVIAAAKETELLSSSNISEVANAASKGSLRVARGNSGVILSQLFRGMAKGLTNLEQANADDLANALVQAAKTAYRAVLAPKEGTMLTIARVLAEKATEYSYGSVEIEELFFKLIKSGNEALIQTELMLAELKQAGVVDAGGKGLLIILEGAYKCLTSQNNASQNTLKEEKAEPVSVFTFGDYMDYGYCTEFFVSSASKLEMSETEKHLKEFLSSAGNSIVTVSDGNMMKIHVHTNNPGAILEYAAKIGQLSDIKIDNMRTQINREDIYEKGIAFVGSYKAN